MRRRPAVWVCVAILALAISGCQEEARVELSQLAVDAPAQVESVKESGPDGVLFRVGSGDVKRLVTFVVPVLKVADPEWSKRVAGWELLARAKAFSLTLRELEAGLDSKTNQPRITGLTAVLSLGLEGGATAETEKQVKEWVWAALKGISAEPMWSCDADASGLVCLVVVGRSTVQPEVVSADRQRRPEADRILDVALGIPGLLRKLETWLGVVAVWAVVPEELATWREIGITWSSKSDQLVLRVSGVESDVLQVFSALAAKRGVDVRFPEGASVVGLAHVSQIRERAEFLRDLWSTKPGVSDVVNPVSWLDDSWQSQLLELASGYAGVAIPGLLDVEDVWGSLVFLFQPTNASVLDARLAHVFSDKGFIHEDVPVRTGESVHRVWRKGKKKTERMSWFVKDGTYYFASKAATLVTLAEKLAHPKGKPAVGDVFATSGGEFLTVRFSPRNFIQGIDLRSQGMGAGMALTMVKNASVKWPEWVYARAKVVEAGGESEIRVELDGVMGWLGQALKDFEPLLNLAGG